MSIVPQSNDLAVPRRGPGRPLGLRSEPALRLAMGYRDESRKGAPVKTDYFIPKAGEDGSHHAAAAKFTKVYGEKPRAIDILLPPSLTTALHVEHIAWGTGGMKARGATNFATVGTLGGPDVLTVWNEDGTTSEVAIESVEDMDALLACGLARWKKDKDGNDILERDLALYTTFQFYIPDVLGAASLCAITSKGQKTTDNLFAKLIELYGYFGSRVTFIVKPKLVLRPATGRPTVTDRETGQPKRIKSSFYALDLYVPESFDEMFERLAQRNELLASRGGPAALLYGGEQKQIEPASADAPHLAGADADEYVEGELVDDDPEATPEHPADAPTDAAPTVGGAAAERDEPEAPGDGTGGQQAGDAPSPEPPSGASSAPGDDDEPAVGASEQTLFEIPKAVIDEAAATVIPKGETVKGMTLAQVAATEQGPAWLAWAVRRQGNYWTQPFRGALELFLEHRAPEIWQAFVTERNAS